MLFLVIIEYLWPTILENSCTAVQSQNAVSAYFTSKQILHFGFVQVYKYTVPWDPQKNRQRDSATDISRSLYFISMRDRSCSNKKPACFKLFSFYVMTDKK